MNHGIAGRRGRTPAPHVCRPQIRGQGTVEIADEGRRGDLETGVVRLAHHHGVELDPGTPVASDPLFMRSAPNVSS